MEVIAQWGTPHEVCLQTKTGTIRYNNLRISKVIPIDNIANGFAVIENPLLTAGLLWYVQGPTLPDSIELVNARSNEYPTIGYRICRVTQGPSGLRVNEITTQVAPPTLLVREVINANLIISLWDD